MYMTCLNYVRFHQYSRDPQSVTEHFIGYSVLQIARAPHKSCGLAVRVYLNLLCNKCHMPYQTRVVVVSTDTSVVVISYFSKQLEYMDLVDSDLQLP